MSSVSDPGLRLLARAIEAHQVQEAAEARRRAEQVALRRELVVADARLAVGRLLCAAEGAADGLIVAELPAEAVQVEGEPGSRGWRVAVVSVGAVRFRYVADFHGDSYLRAILPCGAGGHAHQSGDIHGLADLGAFAAQMVAGCPTPHFDAEGVTNWSDPFQVPGGVVPLPGDGQDDDLHAALAAVCEAEA